jgi:site-specific recombinase XerD
MHSARTADNIDLMGAAGTTETTIFDDLARSWERSLRAAGRSPRTVDSYLESLGIFAAWRSGAGRTGDLDSIDRAQCEDFIVHLLDTRSAATARVRFASMKQFFKWALREGEITIDPMVEMPPPAQPDREVPIITDADLTKLLDSLGGTSFEDRRDSAIVWVLLTTGIRAGELVGMSTSDVDLDARTITVIGKGDRQRTVAIGDQTVLALDRYERARRRHARSSVDAFWLGPKGGITDSGLRQLTRRRGTAAGIADLHPHRFRHTFAHRWLSKGGTEGGLQTAAGWRSPQMVGRYGASAKSERSRAEAARLDLESI